ncbi:MAG TPA: hypothetical protein VJ862_00045 [Rhodanobacteraceae bacterium]|nr:hypothetical protein [Rhodanobacteraceae bacterium]
MFKTSFIHFAVPQRSAGVIPERTGPVHCNDLQPVTHRRHRIDVQSLGVAVVAEAVKRNGEWWMGNGMVIGTLRSLARALGRQVEYLPSEPRCGSRSQFAGAILYARRALHRR